MPPEIARELPDDLLRMIGYAPGAYALGYVDDLRDPIAVLRGGGPESSFGVHRDHAERRSAPLARGQAGASVRSTSAGPDPRRRGVPATRRGGSPRSPWPG